MVYVDIELRVWKLRFDVLVSLNES